MDTIASGPTSIPALAPMPVPIPIVDDPHTGIIGPTCHDGGIRGYGNPESKIVLLGIAPGGVEMDKGRPMVGPSGEMIDGLLSAADIDPAAPYRTNLICTWNNTPSRAEIIACRSRLYQELDWINPKLVICMSKIVQQEFGLHKRGQLYPKQNKDGTWAYWMYTYHPSAVLQGNQPLMWEIARDFEKIPRTLSIPCPYPRPNYVVVDSPRQAQRILDSYHTDERVSIDIETFLHDPNTDDLDIYTDRLRCLSLYNGTEPVYILPRTILDDLVWPQDVDWTLHNGSYDITGLEIYLGCKIKVRRDTMLKSIAIDEYNGTAQYKRPGLHKLENLVGEFFGDTTYKEVTKKAWRAHQEPTDHDLYFRNALDSYYTYHLDDALDTMDPEPAYGFMLLPATNIFADMMQYGVYIDRSAQAALVQEWGPRYVELALEVRTKVDNPRSWKQLSKYLYGAPEEGGLGLPGGPSTSKTVIKEHGHPFTEALIEIGQLRYRLNNWVYGINPHIKPDGRVHPSVWFGLETGRRAYHEPAVQTIPKWGEDLQKIRRLFGVPDPSWCILEADLSQAEMWVAAYLSGDKNLIHDLTAIIPDHPKGPQADVHYSTARRLGGSRQLGKRLNFLMLFGGGAYKLQYTMETAEGIKLPLKQCIEAVESWRETYVDFVAWADEQYERMDKDGYIETPFGYRKRCPLIVDSQMRSSIINFPIQSTAGSYTLSSIIELHPQLVAMDAHILFDVHDSIVIQCRRANLSQVAALVRSVMEAPKRVLDGSTLPSIPCDLKAGKNLEFLEGETYAIA